jgi:hypothetical protein
MPLLDVNEYHEGILKTLIPSLLHCLKDVFHEGAILIVL